MPGVQPPGCLCRPRSCSKASPCETSTVGATFWSWMLTSTFRQGPSAAPAGPVASCLLQVVHLCTDGMSCWQDSSVPKAHWAAACRQDSQLPQPAQVPQCRVPQVLAWTRPLSTSPYVSDACSSYQRRAGMGALRPGELQAPVHFAVQASGSARCQHCAGVWVGGGGGGGVGGAMRNWASTNWWPASCRCGDRASASCGQLFAPPGQVSVGQEVRARLPNIPCCHRGCPAWLVH